MTIKDEDGRPLRSGDFISFSFGIPSIAVLARLNTEDDELWINVVSPKDVKPKREKLATLMKWYQVWKALPARVAAYHRDYEQGASHE